MPAPDLSDLLRAASRTFALGIELLPGALRREVEVAYLLLRVSDHLEDSESLGRARKTELLRGWERVLAGASGAQPVLRELRSAADPTPDALVARNVDAVLAGVAGLSGPARGIVTGYVRESTLGMARWVERGPDFPTEADLDDYMHEVAGRVGYLLTDLFGLHSGAIASRRAALRERGREFGLALQTVNVIRGLHQDHRRGWVFVPRSFLATRGLEPGDLFRPERRADAVAVLDLLAAKAEHHFAGARAYVRLLPRRCRRIRLFCLLPLFFGVRTLAISRGNPDVFREETKITRADVGRIAAWVRLLGSSNLWVDWYAGRLAALG